MIFIWTLVRGLTLTARQLIHMVVQLTPQSNVSILPPSICYMLLAVIMNAIISRV